MQLTPFRAKLAFASAIAGIMGVANSAVALPASFQISQATRDVIVDTETGANPTTTTPTATSTDTRFTCQIQNGEYTVMYHPESQPEQAYPWAVPSQMGGGWTPERRCNAISQRLEFYRPDGLVELKTGVEGTYDVLCATTERDPSCRIVLTVPPGQNPEVTRDLVFENLLVADDGQRTQGVNTFVNGASGDDIIDSLGQMLGIGGFSRPTASSNRSSDGIYLRPFLDRADGGTGTQLRNSVPRGSNQSSPSRLNPDSFR